MIGKLVGKNHLVFGSNETFKLVFNNYTLRVMGVIDKQMKFTPVCFSLDSHADEDASEWALNIINAEVERLHGISVVPWRSMNDSSPSIFNSISSAWPGTRQGNCYFHIVK